MAKEAPQIEPPNKVIPQDIIDSIILDPFIITIFTICVSNAENVLLALVARASFVFVVDLILRAGIVAGHTLDSRD
jgi:hypothetical protein